MTTSSQDTAHPMNKGSDAELRFTFTYTASHSFVLNGKRHTVKRKCPLPAGTYRLKRIRALTRTPENQDMSGPSHE